ncbi:hypothetical protein FNV43_RR22320 [Rhamnella rubrinervis]|uniref:Pentatricopeptide repeat-containing protein n=1 Tax=Rhamnella rubrinervis TaxID=2594499 RepID=A0A8K0DU36_9ROSA|nr:hypothetical protein FNV43_RR22320 [Rhamnella rubrinervis]
MLAPKPVFFNKCTIGYLYRLRTYASPPPRPPPQLSLLADKCTSMDQLKQVHAQMVVSARVHDNFAASRLLSFCALSECGDLSYALRIFQSTREPNGFMWNTLIRAQASGPNPCKAIFLYMKMRRLGVVPGKHTFPFLLKSCSSVRSLKFCRQVHTQVLKFGLDLDLHVFNGLLKSYSLSGCLDDARCMFDVFPERNLSVWTTMVCGYAQNFRSDEALVLFDQMVAEEYEPNGAIPTMASVLSACAQSGCLELGKKIHAFMKEKGIEMGVILGTALVNMYAKNGAISMAWSLFDSLHEKNIATWNAMICGLATHGHGEEALSLFRKLQKEHVMPNDITFVGVLSACCHVGFVECGREIFQSMERVYGIEPKIEHYGCMVDLLGKGGELLEAEELIKKMVWKADVVILGALLAGCRKHGSCEIAERVVKEILVLEPHNHMVHVVLSNIYAEAGRWDDVLRLRKVMKRRNVKRTPGWSIVDDV